jgi:uncharacterized protein (DUF4415 family)
MKTKTSAASSQPEKLTRKSEGDIRAYAKSSAAKEAHERLQAHIRKHGPEPSAADLKDLPALTDEELAKMYRPIKAPVTVRIDGDILAWLRSKGGKYQAHLNATLRAAMLAERKR